MSVPAWLGTLRLCIRTYWVTEKGIKRRADGSEFIVQNPPVDKITCAEGQQVTVTLPRRPATLVGKLDRGLQRLPTTTELQRSTSSKGQPAKILISGNNLWRGTEVYVGAQKADQISLSQDMQSVQAVFSRIDSPVGSRVKGGRVDVTRKATSRPVRRRSSTQSEAQTA